MAAWAGWYGERCARTMASDVARSAASGPAMVTCRNGASVSGTPGEAPAKPASRQGCCEASIASMISRRVSTWPA